MSRLALGLIALSLLPAFAPAPLPKPVRGEQSVLSLDSCQGTWTIVKDETVTSNGWTAKVPTSRAIRIEREGWTSINTENRGQTDWYIKIDPTHKPARIEWYSSKPTNADAKPSWAGLIRRHEGNVQVTYMNTSNVARDFDALPVGATILTLRRGE